MSKQVEEAYKYSADNLKALEDSDFIEGAGKYNDENEYKKAKQKFKGKDLADEVKRETDRYNEYR